MADLRIIRTLLCWSLLFGICVSQSGCRKAEPVKKKKTELLIYCGITMIGPMTEIARIIERQEDCKIIITKDGSGNLLKSLLVNKVGDLYLPGSDSYIKTCLDKGLVSESVLVGYNKAAMMVQKGNPRGISADLENLANKEYYVVIGDPSSGSIGRETKNILAKKGIFAQVMENAREFTTDSKELVNVLADGRADIVVNWYATSTWDRNAEYVDVLPISDEFAKKKKLVIGLLRTSKHPETAKAFMDYAASDAGKKIFTKYGLYDVK